jgi:hypothetical protein
VNRLEYRLKRLEAAAGQTDPVSAILDEIDIWHVDALLLQVIAIIAEASGELVKGGPTAAMLRTSHIGTREKYEAAIAQIPEGTAGRLLSAFIARAREGTDLLDEVRAYRALTLRRNRFTQLFPDEDILEMPK